MRMRTKAFGFNRAKMIDAALKRLFTNVRQQRCNCLQIDDVASRSLVGLPYVIVSVRAIFKRAWCSLANSAGGVR